jgi:hypothetical protein
MASDRAGLTHARAWPKYRSPAPAFAGRWGPWRRLESADFFFWKIRGAPAFGLLFLLMPVGGSSSRRRSSSPALCSGEQCAAHEAPLSATHNKPAKESHQTCDANFASRLRQEDVAPARQKKADTDERAERPRFQAPHHEDHHDANRERGEPAGQEKLHTSCGRNLNAIMISIMPFARKSSMSETKAAWSVSWAIDKTAPATM